MKEIVKLDVFYHNRMVGTLAEAQSGEVSFQYNKAWLLDGFAISPFSLPLEAKVFTPSKHVFDGLLGVFADSLPDGWGRLLVDRFLRTKGFVPDAVSPLTRLAIVGKSGMGALEYRPNLMEFEDDDLSSLDEMAAECKNLLCEQDSKDFDSLFNKGASSGGARPKVLVNIENEPWIIKFPSTYDRATIGLEEFRYMECAKKCGIKTPQVKLWPSKMCAGYFGSKRFDRSGISTKRHMLSVSGLLETSHRTPNLDYNDLMKLTYILTRDAEQLSEMYRRMCFNVFAHNRDDHSKNFAFIYHEDTSSWRLTPAYDLTYSNSIGGWHATCVAGNGLDPGMAELLAVGKTAGMSEKTAKRIATDIQEIVRQEIGDILKSYR